jgi:bla regulator protein blaR1
MEVIIEAVLNGVWQGAALAVVAGLVLKLSPRMGAAARYAAWWIALASVLAVPLLQLGAAVGTGAAAPSPLSLSPDWAWTLAGVWSVMAAVLLARLAWSYGYIRWLARTATLLEPADQRRAAALTGSARFRLYSSHETSVPIVIGLLRPVILLPRGLADRLAPAEIDQIILHEWAHVRRLDHWTNLALELIKALFFFQPAVWWIARRLVLQREIACDDAVVAITRAPLPYAGCLARLAELSSCPPARLAPGAVGDGKTLFHRVERLLDWREEEFPFRRVAAAAVVLIAAMGLCKQAPALVRVSAPEPLAIRAPQPAIEAHRREIMAEVRAQAADIMMANAQRRMREADRILRMAAVFAHEASVRVSRAAAPKCPPAQNLNKI